MATIISNLKWRTDYKLGLDVWVTRDIEEGEELQVSHRGFYKNRNLDLAAVYGFTQNKTEFLKEELIFTKDEIIGE